MIIKHADDHTNEMAQLDRWCHSVDPAVAKAAETEFRIRKAGVKGETESAYFIDFDFSKTQNWVVIHDLRLEHGGRTTQIDHLLIGRTMDCFVLESKHFHAGLKITESGEFLRWNDFKHNFDGMPSPLEQNQRHIVVLRDVMKELPLPVRLGLRLTPEFESLVLISPSARIDRPHAFDTRAIIKADQLKTRLMDDLDKESTLTTMRRATKLISCDTLKNVAELLVGQHRPTAWPLPPMLAVATTTHANADRSRSTKTQVAVTATAANTPVKNLPAATPDVNKPSCKQCHAQAGSILYGKYGYYFQCAQCGTNTNIQFECLPGHHPRLRKARLQFFRDCPECGTSKLYFTNP